MCDLMLPYFKSEPYSEANNYDECIELHGYSPRTINILLFTFLVPTHPNSTTKEEINSWLPTIIKRWKENPYPTFEKYLYLKLIANIATNFKDIDLSEYHDWIFYQLTLLFSGLTPVTSVKPLNKVYLPKCFAEYIVWTYRPRHLVPEEEKLKGESRDFDLAVVLDRYKDHLHPDYPHVSQDIIRFIKLVSSSL